MTTASNVGAESVADQRYYHFVALKDSALSLSAYWRSLGEIRTPREPLDAKDARATLQHRKLRSSLAFARGEVAERLSERGDGRPPYFYDVVAIQADIAGASVFLVGFPFAALARELIKQLLERRSGRNQLFYSAAVAPLVMALEEGFASRYEKLNVHVVGVQFAVANDKHLTNVRLGGDDPLSADIYRGFLKSRLAKGHIVPDRCALACERPFVLSGSQAGGDRLLRSRIHFDNHGNFRVYAQAGCLNLLVLPYALGQLDSARLLRHVTQNPLLRSQDESPD